FFTECGRLQHIEHRGVGTPLVERNGKVFGCLVVDFELNLRDFVAAAMFAGFLERENAQDVADSGKRPGAETYAGAQQAARATRRRLRATKMPQDRGTCRSNPLALEAV